MKLDAASCLKQAKEQQLLRIEKQICNTVAEGRTAIVACELFSETLAELSEAGFDLAPRSDGSWAISWKEGIQ